MIRCVTENKEEKTLKEIVDQMTETDLIVIEFEEGEEKHDE